MQVSKGCPHLFPNGSLSFIPSLVFFFSVGFPLPQQGSWWLLNYLNADFWTLRYRSDLLVPRSSRSWIGRLRLKDPTAATKICGGRIAPLLLRTAQRHSLVDSKVRCHQSSALRVASLELTNLQQVLNWTYNTWRVAYDYRSTRQSTNENDTQITTSDLRTTTHTLLFSKMHTLTIP